MLRAGKITETEVGCHPGQAVVSPTDRVAVYRPVQVVGSHMVRAVVCHLVPVVGNLTDRAAGYHPAPVVVNPTDQAVACLLVREAANLMVQVGESPMVRVAECRPHLAHSKRKI